MFFFGLCTKEPMHVLRRTFLPLRTLSKLGCYTTTAFIIIITVAIIIFSLMLFNILIIGIIVVTVILAVIMTYNLLSGNTLLQI